MRQWRESVADRKRADVTWARTTRGLNRLLDTVTPWLLDLGSWIFGALIAFNLIILGALLTVGPVDVAVKIATAAFALSLPLDVAGFVLLRLVGDLTKAGLADVAAKAFQEQGFELTGARSQDAIAAGLRTSTLLWSYGLLTGTVTLTIAGMTAALWHMAWWIGVAFAAMAMVSPGILTLALSAFKTGGTWQSPAGEPPKS
jgi:hypothetical protein